MRTEGEALLGGLLNSLSRIVGRGSAQRERNASGILPFFALNLQIQHREPAFVHFLAAFLLRFFAPMRGPFVLLRFEANYELRAFFF